ncbi:MAG: ATP-dependent helicase [Patescibacteria group bacterium]
MKDFVLSQNSAKNNLAIDYAAELNAEQFEVVQNGDGPTLVLAGAGSGKTRTITYRVAWLLEHGVDPENILLLTFTNKASKEMIGRVEMLLGSVAAKMWAGTFHSVANRLLRRYASLVGFQPNFSILDQDDAKDLVSLCIKELKIDTKEKRFPSAGVLHGLISYRSNKKSTLESVVENKNPKFSPIIEEIKQVSNLYTKLKFEQNAMDFDDLLLKLLDLLRTRPDIEAQLSEQFQYILVDEFQDTNVVQAEIVHRLAKAHQNLLVVGDDAQSIYSFRAAEIRNILSFPDEYQSANTYKLTKNYRSTPEILSVANAVIEHNKDQFPKDLEAIVSKGAKPLVVPATHSNQEARYIADQLQQIYSDGAALSDIAVLFRAAYHSQALEFELMKRDIPYEYRGGMKFFERAHIKDAVAHLRLFHNVKDGMAWVRALRVHPGLGLVTANKIAKQCAEVEDVKHVVSMEISGKKAAAGWGGFLRILKGMLGGRRLPSDLIKTFSASKEYQQYLENEYPNHHERLDDLEQFSIFAEQFEDIGDFLEAVSLTDEYNADRKSAASQNQGGHEEEDRLILSTIHQAKGLEWDHVFVINLVEGGFPHSRAYSEQQGIEEERRLFYVAVTRARKQLYLTYPVSAGFDTLEIKQPSVFLDEIPQSAVEFVRLRQPKSSLEPSWKAKKSSWKGGFDDGYDEPTIVLNDSGDYSVPPSQGKIKVGKSSFLRNLDEL